MPDSKPKISIRDSVFVHGVALGAGDFNWPPNYFDFDRVGWQKICLFTDYDIINNTVNQSKSKINIGWLLEPVSIIGGIYQQISNPEIYNKYDYIFTHCERLIKTNPNKFKFYPFGGCWIQPENRIIHPKTKSISTIVSRKNSTSGHSLRHRVAQGISGIDIYGEKYKELRHKEGALVDYRFHIVIENDNNDFFFTEKLIDCFVTGTIPIYCGCDISKFFNMDGIVTFKTIEELRSKIKLFDEKFYIDRLPAIKDNFNNSLQYVTPEDYIFQYLLKNIQPNRTFYKAKRISAPSTQQISIKDQEIYKQACTKAATDDFFFNIFKQNPTFKQVLENDSADLAQQYSTVIKEKYPHLLDSISKFITNDDVGGAEKAMVDNICISPSSLRYIKTLGDIEAIFGSLDGMDIIEIGPGYGGQCKMIYDLFKPKSYSLVDLPETLLLSKKYLSKFSINVDTYTFDRLQDRNYDLMISNYAFTEYIKPIQNIYIANIFNRSKNVYIAANFISDTWKINSYTRGELTMGLQLGEKPEEPLTHPKNVILYKRNNKFLQHLMG